MQEMIKHMEAEKATLEAQNMTLQVTANAAKADAAKAEAARVAAEAAASGSLSSSGSALSAMDPATIVVAALTTKSADDYTYLCSIALSAFLVFDSSVQFDERDPAYANSHVHALVWRKVWQAIKEHFEAARDEYTHSLYNAIMKVCLSLIKVKADAVKAGHLFHDAAGGKGDTLTNPLVLAKAAHVNATVDHEDHANRVQCMSGSMAGSVGSRRSPCSCLCSASCSSSSGRAVVAQATTVSASSLVLARAVTCPACVRVPRRLSSAGWPISMWSLLRWPQQQSAASTIRPSLRSTAGLPCAAADAVMDGGGHSQPVTANQSNVRPMQGPLRNRNVSPKASAASQHGPRAPSTNQYPPLLSQKLPAGMVAHSITFNSAATVTMKGDVADVHSLRSTSVTVNMANNSCTIVKLKGTASFVVLTDTGQVQCLGTATHSSVLTCTTCCHPQ